MWRQQQPALNLSGDYQQSQGRWEVVGKHYNDELKVGQKVALY